MQQETPESNVPAERVCGAKTRSGATCKNPPVRGMERCRMHGGLSKSGRESATFKHGRYSKHAPARISALAEEANADPELMSHRSGVALYDARIAELLGKVDPGESGWMWQQVKERLDEFQEARGMQDTAGMNSAIKSLRFLVNKGLEDFHVWNEIGQTMKLRQSLTDSELKRLKDMQQMMTAEQAMMFAADVEKAIADNVTDDGEREAVFRQVRESIARNVAE